MLPPSVPLVTVQHERCHCRRIESLMGTCARLQHVHYRSHRPVNLEKLVFCLQLTAVIIYGLGLHSDEDRNRSLESLSLTSFFFFFCFFVHTQSPKPNL